MRIASNSLWVVLPLLVLVLALAQAMSPSGGTTQAAEFSAAQPAPYAGSDPSVPTAASVQLPAEPAPQLETF